MARDIVITLPTIFFLVATRALDLWITFQFNPSLDREANLITSIFWGGAGALITVSTAEVLVLSVGLMIFSRLAGLRLEHNPPFGFGGFVWRWIGEVLGRRDRFIEWMPGRSRWPHSVQAIRFMSLAVAWAVIFGGAACVIAWLAVEGRTSAELRMWITAIPLGRTTAIPYLLALAGFGFGAALFFAAEFFLPER